MTGGAVGSGRRGSNGLGAPAGKRGRLVKTGAAAGAWTGAGWAADADFVAGGVEAGCVPEEVPFFCAALAAGAGAITGVITIASLGEEMRGLGISAASPDTVLSRQVC